jgi:hypothetical protein
MRLQACMYISTEVASLMRKRSTSLNVRQGRIARETTLLVSRWLRVYWSTFFDVVTTSETSVNFYRTILRHVPEDSTLHALNNLWFSRIILLFAGMWKLSNFHCTTAFLSYNSLSGFGHTTILCSLCQAKNHRQLRLQYWIPQIYCHD